MLASRLAHAVSLAAALAGATLPRDTAAQERRANIYRYVLDMDIPESPGLVALDLLSTKVLRGLGWRRLACTVVFRYP